MGHDLLANLLGAWSEELSLGAILLARGAERAVRGGHWL